MKIIMFDARSFSNHRFTQYSMKMHCFILTLIPLADEFAKSYNLIGTESFLTRKMLLVFPISLGI